MATFVLVHGGWHGGWCWQRLAPPLLAAGHTVLTPTLTGLAERAHLLSPRIDLAMHIEDIVSGLFFDDVRAAILVGHSYGGMVISGVAARAAARLGQLVYLDAFVPAAGQSLFDLLSPQRRAAYRAAAAAEGDGWQVPPPPVAALGLTEAADAAWVAARLTAQPRATLEQPLTLGAGGQPGLPRTFIHCTAGPLATSFAPFAERARREPGWTVHSLATGHDAMLTAPSALAALLLALAPGA